MQGDGGPEQEARHAQDQTGVGEKPGNGQVVDQYSNQQSPQGGAAVIGPRQPAGDANGQQCRADNPADEQRFRRSRVCAKKDFEQNLGQE
jgi:hypothetical protein